MLQQSHPRLARLRACAALFAIVLALTACGGGGGASPADGGNGSGSATGPTTIGPAITIAQTSVVAGQTVEFSIPYDGIISYQWQRNGKDIPGATSRIYTLANPQASDDGSRFTVRTTNISGTAISPDVVLRVSVPKGLALVAGSTGGPGNLDGIDGRLYHPGILAMQPTGGLYVMESQGIFNEGPALRSIDLATGAIRTLQKDFAFFGALVLAIDAAGNRYDISADSDSAIYRTPPGGQRTLFAGSPNEKGSVDASGTSARFAAVIDLAVDAAGNLYVNDDRKKVRKVSPAGQVSTLAGGGQGDMVDGAGALAAFSELRYLAVDLAGNVTVLDKNVLRKISSNGAVTTPKLTTADGAATSLSFAYGLAVDAAGNAFVVEWGSQYQIRKIGPDGKASVLASLPTLVGQNPLRFTNLVADGAGNLYIGDKDANVIRRITPAGVVTAFAGHGAVIGNGDGAGAAAQFAGMPYTMATDAQGNIYVGESDRVRKVTREGMVTTLPLPLADYNTQYYPASNGVLVFSRGVISRIDAAGVSHFIAGQAGVKTMVDGVGTKASFSYPTKLAEDALGNIYLKDFVPGPMVDVGDKVYIRKIAPDGTVTTLPFELLANSLSYWCAGQDGQLWGTDRLQNVVKIAPTGGITIVRPKHESEALVNVVCGRDGALYLYQFEQPNVYTIRKIAPSGVETVIAGTPGAYGVRLGTPGSLGGIDAMTVTDDGTVYVMSENALLRILQ